MKTLLIFAMLFLVQAGSVFAQADFSCADYPDAGPPSTPSTLPYYYPNGWRFTPQGELTVFAFVRQNINGTAPYLEAVNRLSTIRTLFYSNSSQFSSTATDHTISNVLYRNSIFSPDPLKLMAHVFPVVIPFTCSTSVQISTFINNYYALNPLFAPTQGQIDSRSGTPNFQSYIVNNGSDNVIDYIMQFTNNIVTPVAADGYNGTDLNLSINLPGNPATLASGFGQTVRFGSFFDYQAERDIHNLTVHEMNHNLMEQNSHHSGASGVYGNFYHGSFMYGLFNIGRINMALSAQERYLLGWMDIPTTHDFSLSNPTNTTITLADFLSTNKAIRIKFPGQIDQYLWLEYYGTGSDPLDYILYSSASEGCAIPAPNKGLRAYITAGRLIRDIDGNAYSRGGAMLLHAGGNSDYEVTSCLPDPCWFAPLASPDLNLIQKNPTSDQQPFSCVRDNLACIDADPDVIQFGSQDKQETPPPCNQTKNEQGGFIKLNGTLIYQDLTHMSFNGVGTKLGLSSNPFLPLHHRRYDACNNKLDAINLSGLSIEILGQTATDITLQIRWDDVTLAQDPSYNILTGDLHLRPELNTSPIDLSIKGTTSLVLAKSKNRSHRTAWDNSFTNPTILHAMPNAQAEILDQGRLSIKDNSSLWLENSTFTVHSGGILDVRGGAGLVLSARARLVVEPGGQIIVEDDAYVCVGPDAQILIDPAAMRSIGSSINLKANDAFIGYTEYTPTQCQDLCFRDALVTLQAPVITGPSVLQSGMPGTFAVQDPISITDYEWKLDGSTAGTGSSISLTGLELGPHTVQAFTVNTYSSDCDVQSETFTFYVIPTCADGKFDHDKSDGTTITTETWNGSTLIDGVVRVTGTLSINDTKVGFSNKLCSSLTGCSVSLGGGQSFTVPYQHPISYLIIEPGAELYVRGSVFNSVECQGLWGGVRSSPTSRVALLAGHQGQVSAICNSVDGLVADETDQLHLQRTIFFNNLHQGLYINGSSTGTSRNLESCYFVGDGPTMQAPFVAQIDPVTGNDIHFWPERGIFANAQPADINNLGSSHQFSGLLRGIDVGGDHTSGIVQMANSHFERCYAAATNVITADLTNCQIDLPSARPIGLSWLPIYTTLNDCDANPNEGFTYAWPGDVQLLGLYPSIYGMLGNQVYFRNSTARRSPIMPYPEEKYSSLIGVHAYGGAEVVLDQSTFQDLDTAARFEGATHLYGSILAPASMFVTSNRFFDNQVSVLMQNSVALEAFGCNTFGFLEPVDKSPILVNVRHISDGFEYRDLPAATVSTNSFGDNSNPCQNKFDGFLNPAKIIFNKTQTVFVPITGLGNPSPITYAKHVLLNEEAIFGIPGSSSPPTDYYTTIVSLTMPRHPEMCSVFAGAQSRIHGNRKYTLSTSLPYNHSSSNRASQVTSTDVYPSSVDCLPSSHFGFGPVLNIANGLLGYTDSADMNLNVKAADSCHTRTLAPSAIEYTTTGIGQPLGRQTISELVYTYPNGHVNPSQYLSILTPAGLQTRFQLSTTVSGVGYPAAIDSSFFYYGSQGQGVVRTGGQNPYVRIPVPLDSSQTFIAGGIRVKGKYLLNHFSYNTPRETRYSILEADASFRLGPIYRFQFDQFVGSDQYFPRWLTQFHNNGNWIANAGRHLSYSTTTGPAQVVNGIEVLNIRTGQRYADTASYFDQVSNTYIQPYTHDEPFAVLPMDSLQWAVLTSGIVEDMSNPRPGHLVLYILDSTLHEKRSYNLVLPSTVLDNNARISVAVFAPNPPTGEIIIGVNGADGSGIGYYVISNERAITNTKPPIPATKGLLTAWPNPAQDAVSFTGLSTSMQAQVYTADGRLAQSVTLVPGQSLTIKSLPSGLYLLKTMDGRSLRLAIQR